MSNLNNQVILNKYIKKYLNPYANTDITNENVKTMKLFRIKINKNTKKGKSINLSNIEQLFYYLLKYGHLNNVFCEEPNCKSALNDINLAIKNKSIKFIAEYLKKYDNDKDIKEAILYKVIGHAPIKNQNTKTVANVSVDTTAKTTKQEISNIVRPNFTSEYDTIYSGITDEQINFLLDDNNLLSVNSKTFEEQLTNFKTTPTAVPSALNYIYGSIQNSCRYKNTCKIGKEIVITINFIEKNDVHYNGYNNFYVFDKEIQQLSFYNNIELLKKILQIFFEFDLASNYLNKSIYEYCLELINELHLSVNNPDLTINNQKNLYCESLIEIFNSILNNVNFDLKLIEIYHLNQKILDILLKLSLLETGLVPSDVIRQFMNNYYTINPITLYVCYHKFLTINNTIGNFNNFISPPPAPPAPLTKLLHLILYSPYVNYGLYSGGSIATDDEIKAKFLEIINHNNNYKKNRISTLIQNNNTVSIIMILEYYKQDISDITEQGHTNILMMYKTNDTNNQYIAIKFEPHGHVSYYCRNLIRKYIRDLISNVPNIKYIDKIVNQSIGVQHQESDEIKSTKYCKGATCQEFLSPLKSFKGLCYMWCKFFQIFMILNKNKPISLIKAYFEGKYYKNFKKIQTKIKKGEPLNNENKKAIISLDKNLIMQLKSDLKNYNRYTRNITELENFYNKTQNLKKNVISNGTNKNNKVIKELNKYLANAERKIQIKKRNMEIINEKRKQAKKSRRLIFYDYVKTLDFHISIYLSIIYFSYLMHAQNDPYFNINLLSVKDQNNLQNLFTNVIEPLIGGHGKNTLKDKLEASCANIYNLTEPIQEDTHYCEDTLFDYNQFCTIGTQRKTPNVADTDYIAKCGSQERVLDIQSFENSWLHSKNSRELSKNIARQYSSVARSDSRLINVDPLNFTPQYRTSITQPSPTTQPIPNVMTPTTVVPPMRLPSTQPPP